MSEWLFRRLRGSLSWSVLILGYVSAIPAQSPSTEPSPRERTLLAESFTNEKLFQWQRRLGLEDWKITISLVRTSELRPKTLGNIHWDLDKKTALIHVLDPADYKLPFNDMLKDMEFTVVHELIHLELAPVLADLQRSDANRRTEEHSVNKMAEALLQLERNK
jgi:hypothetical protein